MRHNWFAFCVRVFRLTCVTFLWMPGLVTAQETDTSASPESLRLPEVVITGIDRSKVQRMIPKVELTPEFSVLDTTVRDRSDAIILEGDRVFERQARQAEERYLKALAIDPTNSTAYLRLADAYRVQSKYVDATRAYQQALALNAGLLEAHYQLGTVYELYLQDLPQAIEQYQMYEQLGGTDPRVAIWIRDIARQLAGDSADSTTE